MNKNEGRGITKNQINTPLKKDSINSNRGAVKSSSYESKKIENVLVLQGGGSLGAFGCGVFKAIASNEIQLDIVAGTSIGGVNAALIAGSKDEKHPELALEQFWLELSESFVNLDKFIPATSDSLSDIIDKPSLPFSLNYCLYEDLLEDRLGQKKNNPSPATDANERAIRLKQLRSFYSSAIFGNDKMFRPRWGGGTTLVDSEYFAPQRWTYMYDHSPLAKTLEKYINYDKLRPNGNSNSRLILTAVNILTAEPLTFDSYKQQITPKQILATSAYPFYNFRWIEVEDGIYAWDGGLLSNTPLREAIDASPVNDKRIFLVENYPKKVDVLPRNLLQVYHRARDIMFSDKTEHNVTMSRVISNYLRYIEELYRLIENHVDATKVDQEQLEIIRTKYKQFKQERGAEIKNVFHITRDEPFPHIFENADFSPETIKDSIREGEMKTKEVLKGWLDR
jgi:NTE family protein